MKVQKFHYILRSLTLKFKILKNQKHSNKQTQVNNPRDFPMCKSRPNFNVNPPKASSMVMYSAAFSLEIHLRVKVVGANKLSAKITSKVVLINRFC